MKKKSVIHSAKHLILFLTVSLVLSISIIAIAALSLSPEVRGEGNEAETIVPTISGAGDGAEVLIPEAVGEDNEEQKPHELFIPKLEITKLQNRNTGRAIKNNRCKNILFLVADFNNLLFLLNFVNSIYSVTKSGRKLKIKVFGGIFHLLR